MPITDPVLIKMLKEVVYNQVSEEECAVALPHIVSIINNCDLVDEILKKKNLGPS